MPAHKKTRLGDWEVFLYTATDADPGFAAVMVPSAKDPDAAYSVLVTEGTNAMECDCPSGVYRGKCRHQDQVRAFLAGQNKVGVNAD